MFAAYIALEICFCVLGLVKVKEGFCFGPNVKKSETWQTRCS